MAQHQSFEDLLKEFEQSHPAPGSQAPRVGEKVSGVLVSIGEDQAFVDLGGKAEGRIGLAALKDAEGKLTAQVGERIEAHVTGQDEDSGMLLLGHQDGQRFHGLEEVERAYRQGLAVSGQISAAVKGGVEVQIAGLRGFCPASQIDIRFVEDLSEFIGQRLDFRITKLEGGRRPNVVLSRRALLEEAQRQRAEQTRAQLKEGAVLSGTVRSLKDYGAFIDIGGIEGMVHVSELAFGHIKHPGELLSLGQTVEVAVLRIEPAAGPKGREKIALSIRALASDPWADVASRFPVGCQVSGFVSRLQPFGAFIALEPGIDGLVHVSELGAGRRVNHPSEVLQIGEAVEARVLGVDSERRRISLTLDTDKTLISDTVTDGHAQGVPVTAPMGSANTAGSEEHSSGVEPAKEVIGSFGALLRDTMKKGRTR